MFCDWNQGREITRYTWRGRRDRNPIMRLFIVHWMRSEQNWSASFHYAHDSSPWSIHDLLRRFVQSLSYFCIVSLAEILTISRQLEESLLQIVILANTVNDPLQKRGGCLVASGEKNEYLTDNFIFREPLSRVFCLEFFSSCLNRAQFRERLPFLCAPATLAH